MTKPIDNSNAAVNINSPQDSPSPNPIAGMVAPLKTKKKPHPNTLSNLRRMAQKRIGKTREQILNPTQSALIEELKTVKSVLTDGNALELINKILGRVEQWGELSGEGRKKEREIYLKNLKSIRKTVLNALSPEKIKNSRTAELTQLLQVIDDRIHQDENEGHAGSYERRIVISGDVKTRRVEMTEKVSTGDRYKDGYSGPEPGEILENNA